MATNPLAHPAPLPLARLMTVPEIMEVMRCEKDAVYRLFKAGKLTHRGAGRKAAHPLEVQALINGAKHG